MGLPYRARLLLGWEITFIVLSSIAVILRLLAMRTRGRTFRLHDAFCILALVFLIAYATVWSVASFYGIGLHAWQLNQHQATVVLKIFYSSNFLYGSAVIFMRMSILFLYIVLFPQKPFRYWAYGIGTFVFLWPFVLLLYSFGSCIPMSKNWDPTERGHCGSSFAVELVSAAGNGVSDLLLMLMPLPIIWHLRISTTKKIVVSSIFCLSLVTLGINIARIILPLVDDFNDFTYFTVKPAILTTAEIFSGIMVSCMPVLGPIFKYHKVGNSNSNSNKHQHDSWSTSLHQHNPDSLNPRANSPRPPPAEVHHFGSSFNSIDFPERHDRDSGTSGTDAHVSTQEPIPSSEVADVPLGIQIDGPESIVRRSYSGSTAANSFRDYDEDAMLKTTKWQSEST